MDSYLDMFVTDGTGLAVERSCVAWSVAMHCHSYYEIMVVGRGSCRHIFRGVETLLIPGDVVVIPSHEPHGYALKGEMSLYNCQFHPGRLDERVLADLVAASIISPVDAPLGAAEGEQRVIGRGYDSLSASSLPAYETNSTKQGVLHLSPTELTHITSILEHTLAEQSAGDMLLKQKYMEIALLELKKALRLQQAKHIAASAANQQIIAELLATMEADLTQPFDINAAAARYSFSPNYLRKLFTDFTGLAPIQYLNRLRIIRACEYIEFGGQTSRQAAENVGIYDLSYFDRLFKRFIGHTPMKK